MRILSIRSPWWWFILHAGKDIENRDWKWPPAYRGPLLIHASSSFIKREIEDDTAAALEMYSQRPGAAEGKTVTFEALRAGAGHIVGRCDMVDVVTSSGSPWFTGPMGFVLRNPQALKPIPYKAALGLLQLPPGIRAQLEVAP